MIFGKEKKELEELKKDNEKLKAELDKIKKAYPQIHTILALIEDTQMLGAGLLRFERVDPSSVFLVAP